MISTVGFPFFSTSWPLTAAVRANISRRMSRCSCERPTTFSRRSGERRASAAASTAVASAIANRAARLVRVIRPSRFAGAGGGEVDADARKTEVAKRLLIDAGGPAVPGDEVTHRVRVVRRHIQVRKTIDVV